MAEVATVAASVQARKPVTNQGHITGRISSKRSISTQQGRLYLTVLKLAAENEYAHPATVELRSYSSLGEVGDDWSGPVKLSGMPNNYDVRDRTTGEVTGRVVAARNEYIVIE